jgi:hypothetical protein
MTTYNEKIRAIQFIMRAGQSGKINGSGGSVDYTRIYNIQIHTHTHSQSVMFTVRNEITFLKIPQN